MTALEERIRRLEDREALRALDAAYCRLLDDADWPALVELFTEDGEFAGLSSVRGRPALQEFFAGLAEGGLTAFWHHVTNLEIAVDGDVAHLRSFLWQPCVLHGVPHVATGRYTDVAVRAGDGRWRYRSKRVAFDYFAPLTEGWDRAGTRWNPLGRARAPTRDGQGTGVTACPVRNQVLMLSIMHWSMSFRDS